MDLDRPVAGPGWPARLLERYEPLGLIGRGEMGLAVQPHLLRALEVREVCRVGSRRPIPVDLRIVAATNRDLRQAVAQGQFRADLYFRLSCVTVRLPPLRERRDDIPLLCAHFAGGFAARHATPVPTFAAESMALLAGHAWPGNVRELKNAVESGCMLAGEGPIRPEHVRSTLDAAPPASGTDTRAAVTLEAAERRAILEALAATHWNRKAAARRLGIAASTLFEKVRRFGLRPPDGA